MKRRLTQLSWAALCSLLIAAPAGAAAMRTLKGHMVPLAERSTLMSRTPANEKVDISLVVQIDPALMKRTLEDSYRRNARGPKHFLSSAEFAQKFDLAGKRQRLKQYALDNGLAINPAEENPDSMIVRASGSADAVEKMFSVQFNQYRAADGRVFRAQTSEPMVPEALTPDIAAVVGLSNLTKVARPHLRIGRKVSGPGAAVAAPAVAPRINGSGPGSSLAPSDIKTIYGLNPISLTGSGQTVALFELDGYNPTDITGYESNFSLTHVPLTYIGVDGQTNLCGDPIRNTNCAIQDPNLDGGMIEVALDIEMVIALAPGTSRIYVYDSPNTFSGVIHQYDRIATDNLAPVVSTSWGLYELAAGSMYANAEASIFQRMAVQGQGVFAASGDNGAYDDGFTPSVDDPASQPFVTGVGGTTLLGTVASHVETAWTGSGGGISALHTIPSYQSGVVGTATQVQRNVPDVALNADPASGYAVFVGASWFTVGGTSAAAPLWAGFMALVNQQRIADGRNVLGFANPTLYDVALSTSYTSDFSDITLGDNQLYAAGTGYDNATGLGSFKGAAMLGTLGNAIVSFGSESLTNVYAYPNPWDVRRGAIKRVYIANVPAGAHAKVFTLSGFLVKDLTISNGVAIWDLTNDSGNDVASGLYLYLVTLNDEKSVGKIAIIK